MRRTKDNVTIIHTQTVMYENAECPCCGRPRVWRQTEAGLICGTGEDSGRLMSPEEVCWSCRSSLAGYPGYENEIRGYCAPSSPDPIIMRRR